MEDQNSFIYIGGLIVSLIYNIIQAIKARKARKG
jgi:hypothetical protein